MIVKFLILVGVACVGTSLLMDPYLVYEQTSTPFIPAPLWRVGINFSESMLLALFCLQVYQGRFRRATVTMGMALALSLFANMWYVYVDGMERFAIMYGTASTLNMYLLSLVVRMLLLVAVGLLYTNSPESSRRRSL
ncbi:hypothetical protein [Longimicrobium terrae]|uniref:Uncharacterized protein n=1 Tax=Longimicrobium terrae TaxID=1639882 RepID=A0A841H1V5_9BACT|nr:hypothetical protein [Longimicrobium terrae]MBB4637561.1 hypothetical protein [Longimicrobium terrae]MBB6071958.1 hypothetical protein [Longimicrobium terrae]NNC30504.1 hypothetical protein [Longimicrobium terrae]